MVDASHAGVVFTADPLTGQRTGSSMECVSGLGEGLVQGQFTHRSGRWLKKRNGASAGFA